MSNPVDQLPRTQLGAVSWEDSNRHVHLRIYFQDRQNQIRESQWDGSWTGGNNNNVIARDAKPNSPIAACAWPRHQNNTVQIRVYYLDTRNNLREACWVGDKWIAGELNNSNVTANAASQLAAIAWNDGGNINVYYQREDNHVQEVRHTDRWFNDKTLNKALTGTALSSVVWGQGGRSIRVYYQQPNTDLRESCWDQGRGWFDGEFKFSNSASAPLGAISWNDGSQIRVYSTSHDGHAIEYVHTDKWSGPGKIGDANSGSTLAVTQWTSHPQIRVYVLNANNRIQEIAWEGKGWNKASLIPSGNLQ